MDGWRDTGADLWPRATDKGAYHDETFSPVVRFSFSCTLLYFATQNNLHVQVNGHLKEEIYMKQPEHYIKPGQEHLVCQLK